MDISGAVVAEKTVELRQGLGDVAITVSIHDIQMFSCMRVVEPQMAILYRGNRARNGNVRKNRKQGENTKTQSNIPRVSIGSRFSQLNRDCESPHAQVLSDFAQVPAGPLRSDPHPYFSQ